MAFDERSASSYLYLSSLVSGGVAGLMVDIVLFPIDTIKTRIQCERGFIKSGGFKGIYNGLAPAALGSVPTAALFFCTYEGVKNFLLDQQQFNQKPHHSHYIHMASASLAEFVACLVRVPVEIAKQRRQTLNGKFSNSALRILVEAYKSDGLFKGLYRGFGSTILREIPFSFIQIPIWEYLKSNFTSTTGYPLTPISVALCGAVAGGVAAAITTPLDVAKTRIMLAERYDNRKMNIMYILRSIYVEKGITGLFAGFVPRVMFITLGGGIFFGSYDFASRCFKVYYSNNSLGA